MEKLFLSALGLNISEPHTLPRYTGTKGSMHGDTKDSSPPLKANKSDIFSIVYHHRGELVGISHLGPILSKYGTFVTHHLGNPGL